MDVKYSYYNTSKGYRVTGGTAAQFLKADGSVDNNSYIPVNTEINMGDKNLNFTTGSIAKFDGNTRVFNKVFQKYNATTPTGVLSFKFPQATPNATMFDVTIKVHLWNLRTLGTFRIAFYKISATQIQAVYHKAILECSDNFPTATLNAGIDATGNVCINIGDATTVWNTHAMFEVERVVSFYTGSNYDWSKGWSLNSETDTSSYQSLVNIIPEIAATRSWVSANIITSNSPQTGLSGNKTTSGDWIFNGSSANHLSLLRPGQAINNTIGFGFDTLSQYVGLADDNTFAIGNNLNLQSLSFRKFWIDFTKSSVNSIGQIGGSMLGSKDVGGFAITTSTNSSRAEMILRHVWTANNKTYGVGGLSSGTSGSMANWGMWQWFNDRTVNGHDGFIGFAGDKDTVLISSLAGTGTRMVVANSSGIISTQVIPAFDNYYTKSEALNIFVGKNGVETISDTKTFTHSPVVPDATQNSHAVNLSQLNNMTAGFVKVNEPFSAASIMLADLQNGDAGGLYDKDNDLHIAGKEGKFIKLACKVGGTDGIVINLANGHIGYGGVAPTDSHNHYFNGTIRIPYGIYSESTNNNDLYGGNGNLYHLPHEVVMEDDSIRFRPDDKEFTSTSNFYGSKNRVVKLTLREGGAITMDAMFEYQEITIMNISGKEVKFMVNNTNVNFSIPPKSSAKYYMNSIGRIIQESMSVGYCVSS